MYPHTIRLRGPWNYQLADTDHHGTITMPATLGQRGINNYWGKAGFSRNFNWLAKIDADEAVYLVVDGVVGNTTIHLNGREIGSQRSVWGCHRYDITELLQAGNKLQLDCETPAPDTLGFDPYGSLGRSSDSETRGAVAGILGDITLSVELRGLQIEPPLVKTNWRDGKGELIIETTLQIETGLFEQHPLIASLSLDNQPVAEQTLSGKSGPMQLETRDLDVPPWLPRSKGQASLHELVFELRSGGVTVYRQQWNTGFPERVDFQAEPRVGEIWPDRSFLANTGDPREKPFEQWYIAGFDLLHVRDHFAPTEFYKLCDRAGLMVRQDVPQQGVTSGWLTPSDSHHALRTRSAHPCIQEWVIEGELLDSQ